MRRSQGALLNGNESEEKIPMRKVYRTERGLHVVFLFLGYFLKSLIVGRVRGLWSDTAVCLEVLHVSFMSSMHMLRYTRLPRITAVSLGERLWSGLLNISEVKRQHIRSRAEMNTTYFM